MKSKLKIVVTMMMVAVIVCSLALSTAAATKTVNTGYIYGASSVYTYTANLSGRSWGTEYVTINNYTNKPLYCVVGGVGQYISANRTLSWRFRMGCNGKKTVSVKVQPNGGYGTYRFRVATTSGTIK